MAILCVDDYEPYLHLVVETLEDAGYKVFGTSDPCHGLLIATTGNDVRLVITDYILPYISGERLAIEIRKSRPSDADHTFDPNRRRLDARRV